MSNAAVRLEPLAPHLHVQRGEASHVVQFYETDEYLSETVAQFLGAGLAAGEPLVVFATSQHRDAFCRCLEVNGFDVARIRAAARLTFIDAREALAIFMVGSLPDKARFDTFVGAIVSEATALSEPTSTGSRPHVRAYGEMVDLLWRDGNREAATRLEGLWNELGGAHSLSLLCAYRMDNFRDRADSESFDTVCHEHTHVFPTEGYSQIESSDERLREVSLLQQRALALEHEVTRRKELEKQLRTSQADLQDFFENAAEGLHRVGPDGTILWANAAELALLGYPIEEYVGHHIAEFHADPAAIEDILARLSRNETLEGYESRLRCKDGSFKDVLINSNVLWEDGKFVHTRCFTRDITAGKRAVEELKLAEKEAREANRLKDEFLAIVSHELRTPLNAILGWSRLLRSGDLPADKCERALETIERNSLAQVQLVEDLLDVSRIVSGKMRLELARVELSLIVEGTLDSLRPELEAKGLRLERAIDPKAGDVSGDAHRLYQVLRNLLNNAIKVHAERR